MELQLPLLDRMYKEYAAGTAPATLEQLATLYRDVDGFLIISAKYNHGIPPAMKNLLDHFLEEYFWRPSGIVCYSAGMFGGVRAAVTLRATLAELGRPSSPDFGWPACESVCAVPIFADPCSMEPRWTGESSVAVLTQPNSRLDHQSPPGSEHLQRMPDPAHRRGAG
jgi:hypothetical protein